MKMESKEIDLHHIEEQHSEEIEGHYAHILLGVLIPAVVAAVSHVVDKQDIKELCIAIVSLVGVPVAIDIMVSFYRYIKDTEKTEWFYIRQRMLDVAKEVNIGKSSVE